MLFQVECFKNQQENQLTTYIELAHEHQAGLTQCELIYKFITGSILLRTRSIRKFKYATSRNTLVELSTYVPQHDSNTLILLLRFNYFTLRVTTQPISSKIHTSVQTREQANTYIYLYSCLYRVQNRANKKTAHEKRT